MSRPPRTPNQTDRRCSSSLSSPGGSWAWASAAPLTAPALTPAITSNQSRGSGAGRLPLPRPPSPRRPKAPALSACPSLWSRVTSDLHDDFPELATACEPRPRRPRLAQGVEAVDDRAELALAQCLRRSAILRLVAHRRAEDCVLVPEEPPHVRAHGRAGGRPTRDQPTAPREALERLLPRRRPGGVHHDGGAAAGRQGPDFPRHLLHRWFNTASAPRL